MPDHTPPPSAPPPNASPQALQALLQGRATEANWRAIIEYLRDLAQEHQAPSGHEQLLKAAIAWVEEATSQWPPWVRYAELPGRRPFPCPRLVGALYATISGWDGPLVTEQMPRFTQIETLSLNISLEGCGGLPVSLLASHPRVTRCILWAGQPELCVEDPFVLRNAFWALQERAPALFEAHDALERIEVNASAEIDLWEDVLYLEAFAQKERGEPWYSEEKWEEAIAEWRWLTTPQDPDPY